jgi:hypothetical protein
MNERKKTVLLVECDLFRRRLRSSEEIRKMWRNDPEAVEFIKRTLSNEANPN